MESWDFCLPHVEYFDPQAIAESGQAFRFSHVGNGIYKNIAKGKVIYLKREEDHIYFKGLTEEEFDRIWRHYFDLDRDYRRMRDFLRGDPLMKKALDYGWGIRLLNQEIFETVITFILSANSHIPRIKAGVEKLSKLYSKPIDGEHHAFPKAEDLAVVSPEELRTLVKVGYRDQHIVKSAEMIASREVDLEAIGRMDLFDARKALTALSGVGEKVADCILLFGYGRKEVFPVDVWIKRVMEEIYFKKEVPKRKVGAMGREIFGKYAGYANQYLFYYGRVHQLGKE